LLSAFAIGHPGQRWVPLQVLYNPWVWIRNPSLFLTFGVWRVKNRNSRA